MSTDTPAHRDVETDTDAGDQAPSKSRFSESDEIVALIKTVVHDELKAANLLNSEWLRLVQAKQDGILSENKHLKDSLELQLDAQVNAKLDGIWDFPKKVLWVLMSVGTLVFAANIITQFFTFYDLRGEAAALRGEATALRDEVKNNQDRWSAHAAARKHDILQVDRMAAANASALRIIGLLDVARDQLYVRSNFDRANHYATQAEVELASLKKSGDVLANSDRNNTAPATSDSPSKLLESDHLAGNKVISQLGGAISLVQAECVFRANRIESRESLHKHAQAVVDSGCGCLEGHFYLGVYHFQKASDKNTNPDERSQSLRAAREEFGKAAVNNGDSSGTLSSLLLAGIYFEQGDFNNAAGVVNSFVRGFPESTEARRLLPSERQAQLYLAETIRQCCGFVTNHTNLTVPVGCQVDVGAIGAAEAALFFAIFNSAIDSRIAWISDPREADLFGLYCLNVNRALQRSNCRSQSSETCIGCRAPDSTSEDTVQYYREIVRRGMRLRIDMGNRSSDRSLGVIQSDGSVVMRVLRPIDSELNVLTTNANGRPEELVVPCEDYHTEEKVFSAGESVPSDFYIDSNIAVPSIENAPAPAAPAPAPAPAAPAPAAPAAAAPV